MLSAREPRWLDTLVEADWACRIVLGGLQVLEGHEFALLSGKRSRLYYRNTIASHPRLYTYKSLAASLQSAVASLRLASLPSPLANPQRTSPTQIPTNTMQSVALLLSLVPLALALPQEDVVSGPPAPAPTVTAAPTETADYSNYGPTSSVPAMDIISALYGTSIPPQVSGAVATSLASALYSQAADWQTDSKYASLANEVYMAAATASPSVTDFGLDGVDAPFTTASWYKNGVPKSVQTEVESYYRDLAAVPQSVFSAAGITVASATPLRTSGATASASDNNASSPTPTGSVNSGGFSGSGSAHSGSSSADGVPLDGPDDSGAVTVAGTALAGVVAALAMGVVAAL